MAELGRVGTATLMPIISFAMLSMAGQPAPPPFRPARSQSENRGKRTLKWDIVHGQQGIESSPAQAAR